MYLTFCLKFQSIINPKETLENKMFRERAGILKNPLKTENRNDEMMSWDTAEWIELNSK